MSQLERLDFDNMSIKQKEELLVEEIKKIVSQILEGVEPQSCKCSYLPLRQMVADAINGVVWERYRLIKYGNEHEIRRLARKIIRWDW